MLADNTHDQTVAEDYFSAMQKVEQKVDREEKVVKVQELELDERLDVGSQLRETVSTQ